MKVRAGTIVVCMGLVGFLWGGAVVGSTLDDDALRAEIYRMVLHDPELLQSRIQQTLFSYLDEPENMELVIVPDSDARLLAGGLRELSISFENSYVRDLLVRRAEVMVRNCLVDWEQMIRFNRFRFRDQGQVDLLLTVTEHDLNEMMATRGSRRVRNARLDFRPGHIRFSGRLRVLFFNNHVRVACNLSVRDGDELHFTPRWMNLDFLPVPRFVVGSISRRMNPVASLERLKFSADLTVIETSHDSLYIATESMRDRVDELLARDAERRAAEADAMDDDMDSWGDIEDE